MKSDQRVVVTFGLICLILLVWTIVSPTPQQAPEQQAQETAQETVEKVLPQERAPISEDIQKVAFDLIALNQGLETSKIHSVELDGELILDGAAGPGFLTVDWSQRSTEPIQFSSSVEGIELFSTALVEGNTVEIRRVIRPSTSSPYMFECEVSATNRSKDAKTVDLSVSTFWPIYGKTNEDNRYQLGLVSVSGDREEIKTQKGFMSGPKAMSFDATPLWITSQGKSNAVVVLPERNVGTFHVKPLDESVVGWLDLEAVRVSPMSRASWKFDVYVGPIDFDILTSLELEETISLGMFSGVARFLLKFLRWAYNFSGNYGVAILLLSLLVWLPFAPLSMYGMKMSTNTMQKMAEVKPKEAKIRKDYANNPQKMQKELMELYRKHKINPASGCLGCLPFLFQWPIFMALFQVLNRAPQLRGAEFLWIKDLSAPDALFALPFTLPLLGSSFNLLPILATIGMFFQQKYMRPPQQGELTEEQKAQQAVFKFFPVMLLFLFYRTPSGFMLYWVCYSIFMMGQQILVARGRAKT